MIRYQVRQSCTHQNIKGKVLGTRSLSDILTERVTISSKINDQLVEGTGSWGVTVERVEVKDVCVPEQLVTAMAAEAKLLEMRMGKLSKQKMDIRPAELYDMLKRSFLRILLLCG